MLICFIIPTLLSQNGTFRTANLSGRVSLMNLETRPIYDDEKQSCHFIKFVIEKSYLVFLFYLWFSNHSYAYCIQLERVTLKTSKGYMPG